MITMSADCVNQSFIEPEEGSAFIYRLINKGEVVYVGQTKNIKKRIYQHKMGEKVFELVSFYPCEMSKSTEIEVSEIIKFKPKLNKELPKTNKYITIKQAAKLIAAKVSKAAVEHLDIAFKNDTKDRNGHTYISASEVNNQAAIIIDIVNDFFKKETRYDVKNDEQ